MDLGLAGKDCQHAVTDKSLSTVSGCALGTDVCHWMFKTKVNMVQGQEDGPLRINENIFICVCKNGDVITERIYVFYVHVLS